MLLNDVPKYLTGCAKHDHDAYAANSLLTVQWCNQQNVLVARAHGPHVARCYTAAVPQNQGSAAVFMH